MIIEVVRGVDTGECTLGFMRIDGKGTCFTLEDTYRETKVVGNTCIPKGVYEIKLRTEGGMTKKYKEKFGYMHRGMLWLQDVPNFEWVYIHYGNYPKDTEGCILVGTSADVVGNMVGNSVAAYKEIYPQIASAIEDGEKVFIEVV